MSYEHRFVEIGRIAYVSYGADKGKLCVIVDVVDQNRALIDGPSNIKRKACSFKNLQLTTFKLNIPHTAQTKMIEKAWEAADITKMWQETIWAKKLAAQKRKAEMTDYDRFKLMKAKQARNRIIKFELGRLVKKRKGIQKKPTRKTAVVVSE